MHIITEKNKFIAPSGNSRGGRLFAAVKMLIILTIVFCDLFGVQDSPAADSGAAFRLSPWKVGQFVEYQAGTFDGKETKNRYRFSIVAREIVEGREYFWIVMDIFNAQSREFSLKALVAPFNEREFAGSAKTYVSAGMLSLFKNARKVCIELNDGSTYEIDKDELFKNRDILRGSFYDEIPEEKNYVNYEKLKYSEKSRNLTVPAGTFNCYRFFVETTESAPYADEGFDLWRSEKVPLLGIVKMVLSKSEYVKKKEYDYYSSLKRAGDWMSWFQVFIFKRTVPWRVREDDCIINLTGYRN